MTARDRYRQSARDTLYTWRFDCLSFKPTYATQGLFHSALADIISFRLRIAYTPIFETLARIHKQLDILADSRTDFYAPPTKRVFPMRIEATR